MKRLVPFLLALAVCSCGLLDLENESTDDEKKESNEEKNKNKVPLVVTGDASSVDYANASVEFTIDTDAIGDFDSIEAGIKLGKESAPDSLIMVLLAEEKNAEVSGDYVLYLHELQSGATYQYCAYAIVNDSLYVGAVKTFKTKTMNLVIAQSVDLGLSVKWAGWNLGASKPSDFGDYYAWGMTSPGGYVNNFSTYGFGHDPHEITKYVTKSEFGADGKTDGKTVLEPDDDAATHVLGEGWRIPTKDEKMELLGNTDILQYVLNDTPGWLFVSKKNGNAIFVPAGGYKYSAGNAAYVGDITMFWTSSLCEEDNQYAYVATDTVAGSAILHKAGFQMDYAWNLNQDRSFALNIRPVYDPD